METIQAIIEDIERGRVDVTDTKLDAWVGEQLADLRADAKQLTREDAYARYLRRGLLEYDADENGGKPRCTCGNDCPVLNRRLPARVRAAGASGAAVEDWAVEHIGTPHALLVADDAYRHEWARVRTEAQRIRRAIELGEIPAADAETGGSEVTIHGDD